MQDATPDRVLEISKWRTPATAYPRAAHGDATVVTRQYKLGFYDMYGVPVRGRPYKMYETTRRIRVTTLAIAGREWMVDDPPHWYGIRQAAAQFKGHVLCAGLGLGLIVHALRTNRAVRRITVVERNSDVVELVLPHVTRPGWRQRRGPPVTVYRSDWWDVDPRQLAEWTAPVDGVFFDLLVGKGACLVGEALRAVIDMRERWPGVPHHVFGMNNAVIQEMLGPPPPVRHPGV